MSSNVIYVTIGVCAIALALFAAVVGFVVGHFLRKCPAPAPSSSAAPVPVQTGVGPLSQPADIFSQLEAHKATQQKLQRQRELLAELAAPASTPSKT
jgi:F420-0:gamma-glutamyl ligase-like protein